MRHNAEMKERKASLYRSRPVLVLLGLGVFGLGMAWLGASEAQTLTKSDKFKSILLDSQNGQKLLYSQGRLGTGLGWIEQELTQEYIVHRVLPLYLWCSTTMKVCMLFGFLGCRPYSLR